MADKRSYEKDLWDGIKQVYDRYDEGKKTLSEMHKFLAERAKIEEHYAKGLQALASGKPGGSTEARTIGAAWGAIKQDHEAQQRLRANLAQTITKDLVGDLGNFKKEATKQKETLSTTVANLNKDLEKGKATVTKAKQNYHSKSESAENALLNYEKAQQDPTHPPKTLTKLNTTAQKAKKEAEVADAAYQQSVQEFQQFQLKYQESMKTILNEFQMLEERRTVVLRDNMEKLINAQDALLVELQRSNQQVQEVVAEINGLQDVQDWISENKTGLVPSKPTEYEPYKWQFEHPSVPASQKSKIASSSGASVKKDSGPSVSTSGGASVAKKTSAPSTAETSRDTGAESSGAKKAKANYDYAASDDTEISFDVDDIILVHKVDDSGWWEGEIRGKRGLFPGNYVELIESSGAADNVKKCRAVYEFKGDNDDELSIAVGDIIVIDSETEGWFSGTNSKGKSGMFPANYVELL